MEAFVIGSLIPILISVASALSQTYGKVVSVSRESATLNRVEELNAKYYVSHRYILTLRYRPLFYDSCRSLVRCSAHCSAHMGCSAFSQNASMCILMDGDGLELVGQGLGIEAVMFRRNGNETSGISAK